MAVTQYVGARYVPLFSDPLNWDSKNTYEPLTIVYHQGNSYTSRQYVPADIQIDNEKYWALTGNYNAQIEQYRKEVAQFDNRIKANESALATKAPNNHASQETTYGIGNSLNYGHVRLANNGSTVDSDENSGTAATPKFVLLRNTAVTPEQYGATGDGVADDTQAVLNAVKSGKNVIGNGSYKCTAPIDFNKSNQYCFFDKIVSTAAYAVSIGNDAIAQDIHINEIDAQNAGLIVKTAKLTARHNVHIGVITAHNGKAAEFKGGGEGVLDCFFSGQAWAGTTGALSVNPTDSYIGNITFSAIRFTATAENSTQITLDSSQGAITQLHFPECSVEPEPSVKKCNGIFVNVVNNIELVDGYFRTTELTSKTGYILKIKGTIRQQLSQGLHLTFDHIAMSQIDLSEVNIGRYYGRDTPICIIDCSKVVFAGQPQTTRVCIYGNKRHCQPIRRRYALSSGNYNWTFDRQIETNIEFNANGELNIPEWFNPDTDTLFVNPASHTVTLKIHEYDTDETIGTLNDSNWVAVSFYRDNNNVLKMIKK